MSDATVNMPIYLDHAATTPMLPEVADAVREASLSYGANPASQHGPGREARRRLEEAREQIGELLGAKVGGMKADRVILTSGGTEANNLAILGLNSSKTSSLTATDSAGIMISPIEHPCIEGPAAWLEDRGVPVERLPVAASGVVGLGRLENLSSSPPRLVSLMLGNNETGVLQPVQQAAELCNSVGIVLHTDASQAVGKHRVDFTELGAGALTCTAHKLHGPLGIGALIVKHGAPLSPQLHGGFQQAGLRAGTESVALAVGMAAALQLAISDLESNRNHLELLRKRFENAILTECDGTQAIGAESPRLPHISNIAFVGCDRQALVMALDLAGVACSTGSACASGSSEPSPALLAMGLAEGVISGSVRFSFASTTTESEIDEATRRILNVHSGLRQ
ncbi:cysteine desulfurase family protein [Adhaeretor mobilis]|uniref:Cysteine desulfurase n=1 Tax=Adhaeretor mobilis TaxID=1930276 RepID=A0A517N3C9_9BACT|nr:cysteine desulfurase family protein [Adhaeretor mobilis]QDT01633.1 Cysteine desulfurase [Adhaeretor mobilis]